MAYDYEDKIAKLLAKAEANGTTPQEAEALSEMAEKLMVKYGIDRATAEARRMAEGGKRSEAIVEQSVHFTGEYRQATMLAAYSIVLALGLKAYKTGGNFNQSRKSGLRLYIIGFESDVKAAIVLVTSLQIQGANALNVWTKTSDNYSLKYGTATEKRRARFDFLSSFGGGAATRVKLAREAATAEATNETPGTALVLVDRSKAVEDYYDGLGLGKARATSRKADWSAREAGHAAGKRANTGETNVGGSHTSIGG